MRQASEIIEAGIKASLGMKDVYSKGKRIGQELTQRNGKRFFRFVSSEGKYSEWEEEGKQ